MPLPLVLGEAVMVLGADRRALSAAFLASRLEGESTFSKIGALGTAAFVGIGAAAGAAFTAATKGAANLQFAISGAGAVAFATTSQLAAMTKQSLDLSHAVNSTFKPTEIAGAMEVMVKAGTELTDVLNGGAAAAITLASAGGTTLAEAGTFVSTAMSIWNLETSDLTKTINTMAGAANLSRFDVNDLARAVANGGAQARVAGVPFDEFIATVGSVAPYFNSGAEAGTAFKNFISKLIPTTKAAKEEMLRLGFITEDGANKFFDASGKIKPMVEIVQLMNEALGDAPPADVINTLNRIFSPRGAGNRLAVGLIRQTREEFLQFKGELANMSAADIAAARLDNAQGAATRFLRTIQALGMELGFTFLERIKRFALLGTQELPKIFDAMREGLTGRMAPARTVEPSLDVLRGTTNTSDEGAGRGMVGAGPSRIEVLANRAGTAIRTQLIPRLVDLVSLLNNFARHDIWPKLQTLGVIVGTILAGAFKTLLAVGTPVLGWLSQHKEVVGALIAAYLTYVTVSAAVALAIRVQTAAMVAYRTAALGVLVAQGLLNGVLLVSPWTLLAIAVAGLVAGAILLYKNWDAVKKLLDDIPVGWAAFMLSSILLLTTYTSVARGAAIAQWALNTALAANPVGLVVVAVSALAAAAFVLEKELDTLQFRASQVSSSFLGAESATSRFAGGLVTGLRNAIAQTMPGLGLLMEAINLVQSAMDRLTKKQVTGGRPTGEVGGRVQIEPGDVPRDEEGRPLSLAEQKQSLFPTSGNEGPDWRNAPPSNPNFIKPAERTPLPKGWRYDADGNPELDFDIEDQEFAGGDFQMPAEDEAAAKKKKADDRLQNAIDALNTRFFNDLSEQLFKEPNKGLGPLIAKQGMIRAEISRTAQMLMSTLGVELPEAFERASELVLERIDDMEKELEKGPKVSGFLGFMAAWADNIAKFNVNPSSANAKLGDTYILNGGLNITPDPDVPGGIDVEKAKSVWAQQKFARQQ